MNININQRIKVKLTDSGKLVYKNYLAQFKNNPAISQVVPEEMEMPLWEFCQIFGHEMFMGNTRAPFTVNNEFELLK